MIMGSGILIVDAMVMPLGPFSDGTPWRSDGVQAPFRISANDMRKYIRQAPGLPVTLSACKKKHSSNPIGFVQKFRVVDNELRMFASIWKGALPADFDITQMGCSLEIVDAEEHCHWFRTFTLNAVALVLRKDAAFKSTYVTYVREIKCTDKTSRVLVK